MEIAELQFRHEGTYRYDGEEKDHYLFTHMTTDRQYWVAKKSVKKGDIGIPGETYFIMNLLQWEGEWMLTGTMMGGEMEPEAVEKEKYKQSKTPWIYPEERLNKMAETTGLMYKAFVDFFGSPLAWFGSQQKLQEGMNDFFQFYHKRLGGNEADFQRRREEYRRKFGNPEIADFSDLPKGHDFGMIFIEGIGMITLQDIRETMILLKKGSLTHDEKVDLFYDLLANYQPRVAEYMLQTFGNKNFENPHAASEVDAWRDRHFYWRFYNPQEFDKEYPIITMVDMG
ncbi:MAG: hypothetical protein AAB316_09720 [Bacteroidota bacterium]